MHGHPPKAKSVRIWLQYAQYFMNCWMDQGSLLKKKIKKIKQTRPLYSISLYFPLSFDFSSSPQAAVRFLFEQGPRWASWLLYHFIYLPSFYVLSLFFSLSLSLSIIISSIIDIYASVDCSEPVGAWITSDHAELHAASGGKLAR